MRIEALRERGYQEAFSILFGLSILPLSARPAEASSVAQSSAKARGHSPAPTSGVSTGYCFDRRLGANPVTGAEDQ
jgi:hypothetical protein